jgi:hypothetical protein
MPGALVLIGVLGALALTGGALLFASRTSAPPAGAGAAGVLARPPEAPRADRFEGGAIARDDAPPQPAPLPEAGEPSGPETRGRRALTDAELASVSLDTELYGRVFIARISNADGSTPWDAQARVGLQLAERAPEEPDQAMSLGLASADDDGLWRWPLDEALGQRAFHVSLDIKLRGWDELIVTTAGRADAVLDVRLPDFGTLHGAVPLEHLHVKGTPRVLADWDAETEGGASVRGSTEAAVIHGTYRLERRVLGRVRSIRLRSRSADVVLASAATLTATPLIVPEGATVRRDLAGNANVVVTVLDDRTSLPVAGARVELLAGSAWTTDADGTAWLVEAEPNEAVTVAHDEHAGRRSVPVPDGPPWPRTVTVRLPPYAQVSGWVRDTAGRPVDDAWITLWQGRSANMACVTDAAGWFRLDRVTPHRQHVLVIESEEHAAVGYALDVVPDAPPRTWILSDPPRVTGRVLRADGSAAAGASVALLALGLPHIEADETGPDGSFEFDGLRVGGEYVLCAHEAPGNGRATRRLSLALGRTEEVVVTLAPAASAARAPVELTLSVVHAEGGEPLSGPLELELKLWTEASTGDWPDSLELAPGARAFPCPRGMVTLTVSDPSGTYASTDLTLDTGTLRDGSVIRVHLEPER